MNELLYEVNEIYKQIQDYVSPNYYNPETIEWLYNLPESELEKFEKYRVVYDYYVKDVIKFLNYGTPEEIANAYQEGCRLLQQNLSGHMIHHWFSVYRDVMEKAIRNHHFHTGYLFLRKLANEYKGDYDQLVIESINISAFRETALGLVVEHQLCSAKEIVRTLAESEDEYTRLVAESVLSSLNC